MRWIKGTGVMPDRPLQNRVHPDGSLHAVPVRGLLMGNRGGRLHDRAQRLGRRRWVSKAWICCEIAFRGRRRRVWGDSYTELFFLDEATALAAGHRPCFECRRSAALAFAEAAGSGTGLRAAELDAKLHAERLGPRETVAIAGLPVGAMIADADGPLLVAPVGLRRWHFEGYSPARTQPARALLLTPPTALAALAAGYAPRLHPSA
jgi:hypothetical protein